MRIHLTVLVLAVIAAVPALPDIVDVTFTPGLGFSGSVIVRCDTCPGGFGESSAVVPISSTPNSFSGRVSFTDPGTGRTGIVTGQVTQNNSSTSDSFDVGVMQAVTFGGVGAEWAGQGTVSDNFTVAFTLTTASSLDLSNSTSGGFSVGLLGVSLQDSMGNVEFSSPSGAFDTTLLLAPGAYTLTSTNVIMVPGGPGVIGQTFEADFDLSADFTQVPEPSRTPVVMIACLTLVGIVASRRKLAL
jgi:hypothetical protein